MWRMKARESGEDVKDKECWKKWGEVISKGRIKLQRSLRKN